MVINLPLFPVGSRTAINYIPNRTSGIYAWFRNYRYPDAPDAFFEKLIEDIERPKFIERTGNISPYYQVGIRSYGKLSDGKRLRLKEAIKRQEFRDELQQALGNSIMFQSPLYVGKATNLRKRVAQHLAPDGLLRNRLQGIGVDLDNSLLLIYPLGDASSDNEIDSELSDCDSEDVVDTAENAGNAESMGNEDLFEEIYSRLFSPQFSIRLG